MQFPAFSGLVLEAALPSRWSLAEPRQLPFVLRNECGVELKDLQLRASWASGKGREEEDWKPLGRLARGAWREESVSVPPPGAREDSLHLSLKAALGSILRVELGSAGAHVVARQAPDAGAVNVVIHSDISGDKIGCGQAALEGGAHIGPQVHVHDRSMMRQFEDWLEQDEWRGRLRLLPLFVAEEACLPWTTPHGLELAGIPRGEFVMGASLHDAEAEPDEHPRREVTLTSSRWMSRHPVTNAQWTAVMEKPSPVDPVKFSSHLADRMPVANVTWGAAVDFCARLTRLERAAGGLPPGYAYRLPTEAEWEHACRAGGREPRYGRLEKIGSVRANGGRMMEAGLFPPNDWGLHDMLGLVFEWCLDAYAPYRVNDLTDPLCWSPAAGGALGRVVRGGCYMGPDSFARASARAQRDPGHASHRIGFRVVLAREN